MDSAKELACGGVTGCAGAISGARCGPGFGLFWRQQRAAGGCHSAISSERAFDTETNYRDATSHSLTDDSAHGQPDGCRNGDNAANGCAWRYRGASRHRGTYQYVNPCSRQQAPFRISPQHGDERRSASP
jgi:hypothetical protein